MAWFFLGAAGVLEVVWAFAMKQSAGLARLDWSALAIVAALGSFGLLALAMRALPLGTAYIVWTGIGAVGSFAIGIAVLGESMAPARVLAALLIVSGLVLMKLTAED